MMPESLDRTRALTDVVESSQPEPMEVTPDFRELEANVAGNADLADTRASDAEAARALASTARLGAEQAQAQAEAQVPLAAAQRGLAETARAASESARTGAEAARNEAQIAAVSGRVSKPTKAELDAVFADYPVGAVGVAETGPGSGEYAKRSGVSSWVYTGPTTGSLAAMIAPAGQEEGIDLLFGADALFRAFRFLPNGGIISDLLKILAGDGDFTVRDELGRVPFALTQDGLRLGNLLIAGGGSGIELLANDRRVIASWLPGYGLRLADHYTRTEIKRLIAGLALPAPQVGDPIFGPHLFAVTGIGMEIPVYARNIQPVRQDRDQAAITLASNRTAPAAPYVRTSRESLIIEADKLGSTASLTTRGVGETVLRRVSLTVRSKAVPVAGSPAPRLLMVGDSITNRQTGQFINSWLAAWGFAPAWMGTVQGSASASSTIDAAGPLGEGREGWAFGDYFATDADADVLGVIAPGQEAAYLGYDKPTRGKHNVFLRTPTGGDPADRIFTGPFGTFVFDFRFFLNRWSGTALASTFASDPTVIGLNIGMNDALERQAGGVTNIALYLPIMVESIRAALPNVPILLWQTATPVDPISDTRWDTSLRAVAQKVLEVVLARRAAGDANIYFVNTHASQTREAGFDVNAGTTSAVTGVQTTSFGDNGGVHPTDVNRSIQAMLLAAAIATFQ